MKRRAISFITALALCLSLCSVWVLAADEYDPGPASKQALNKNTTETATFDITGSLKFDTGGYSYTVTGKTAVSVKSGGRLYLTAGTIQSTKGAGIEVLSGGFLRVEQADMTVTGTTYGLDIASNATVRLSGGTFTGSTSAIRASGGNYGALLVSGCAFFDADGSALRPDQVAGQKTVTVKECTNHVYDYTATAKAPSHSWACRFCDTAGTEFCTFDLDENGHAECTTGCGHTLDVMIDPVEETYDGGGKPDSSVSVTVTLDKGTNNSTTLAEGAGRDYTVERPTRVDVGETAITVTSTRVTLSGAPCWSYETGFRVTRAKPEITWKTTDEWADTNVPISVKYDGGPVDKAELPEVEITPACAGDLAELKQLLYYSFKEANAAGDSYTQGLPTDAGTYTIRASLPPTTNYTGADSVGITLTIEKIKPITSAPKAVRLTYTGAAQELVTGGTARDGAVILFATSVNGPWSLAIPTGIDADDYVVWYKVEETGNYYKIDPVKIDVTIGRKEITPVVELEYYTVVYDGGFKEPKVTVRDPDNRQELPPSEYNVHYWDNRAVNTAKVIVSNEDGGNYTIKPSGEPEYELPEELAGTEGVIVTFQITPADQAGLTITNQPGKVTYGDEFTLGTSGGSGNGTVSWEITAAKDGNGNVVTNDKSKVDKIATIDPASGQVTVTGVGTITVRATKSGTNNDGNHADATAEWTFTATPKRVTATVTAADKVYNGNANTTVEAAVEQGDLAFDDVITITGPGDSKLTGTFSDAGAGTGKTVTVNMSGVVIKVNGTPIDNGSAAENYIVAIPSITTANITRAEAKILVPPASETLTYNGGPQPLITTKAIPNNNSVVVEYAPSKDGPYSTDYTSVKATDAGRYEVWYRVQESANYTGVPAVMIEAAIQPKPVTNVVLDCYSYMFDGSEKRPAVTVKDGEVVVSPDEYTVSYSNNIAVGKDTDGDTAPTVTVTDRAGGNYEVSGTAKFSITMGKAILTGTPQAVAGLTYNGKPQNLVTVGAASGGELVYAWKECNAVPAENDYSTRIPTGEAAGEYAVYYKVKGDDNHEDTEPDVVYVTIRPKTVADPVIRFVVESSVGGEPEYQDLYRVEYNKGEHQPLVVVKDGSDEIPSGEYTVSYSNNINAGTATVRITDNRDGNYTVSGSATFEITKTKAAFATNPKTTVPDGKTELVYKGKPLELVTPGIAAAPEGGTVVYSLNGGEYSDEIPTGKDVDTYTVLAKVQGDANYDDSDTVTIEVTIGKNEVAQPVVDLSPRSFRYNGSDQKPAVTVKDGGGDVISADEYTMEYIRVADHADDAGGSDVVNKTVDVGTYQIRITARQDGNYKFEALVEEFTIIPADQTPLEITGKPDVVCYGDKIELGTTGGADGINVTWSIEQGAEAGEAGIIAGSDGEYFIKGTGKIIIKVTKTADNYETVTDKWEFYAYPKPIALSITAEDKDYDGGTSAKVAGTLNQGDLVSWDGTADEISFSVTGAFDNATVGTNKQVRITVTFDEGAESARLVSGNYVTVVQNYEITYPAALTASIYQVDVKLTQKPALAEDWVYDGETHPLLADEGGVAATEKGIGTVEYSLSEKGEYSADIPKVRDAGAYTVWYRVADSVNWKGIGPTLAGTVTVAPRTVSNPNVTCTQVDGKLVIKVTYGSGEEVPDSEYTFIMGDVGTVTITLSGNYTFGNGTQTMDFDVTVENDDKTEEGSEIVSGGGSTSASSSGGGSPGSGSSGSPGGMDTPPAAEKPGAETASVQTSVRDGVASTVVNGVAADELVNKAVENQSEAVVIKPEIDGDVTRTEVSIPASAVGRLGSETDAALTVSTPVADVTIPNAALEALSNAGGDISVAAERVENTVVLSLTADGEEIGEIPGGLTLTVPAEDDGPGTVAVIVCEDGTRKTVRWSVADGGVLRIPLDGSATLEIVDNSKEFADVSKGNWEADAVAFASAHELFNGYSDTTFSPNTLMSRGMLVTVLYNLEGKPELERTGEFNDVDRDIWYAAGISWAAANGVVSGYGNGQFGPNDNITREQLAVMLWRYMGSPAADEQTLDFKDADQTSGYAMEALYWAAENGILAGYGNGYLDPGGLATRAQAAQMLKNFIVNH